MASPSDNSPLGRLHQRIRAHEQTRQELWDEIDQAVTQGHAELEHRRTAANLTRTELHDDARPHREPTAKDHS